MMQVESYKINVNEATKVPIGIGLPLVDDGSTFFKINYTSSEQFKTNLRNLLLTSKGERIMYPTYGCDLKKSLFEENNLAIDRIEKTIKDSINRWLPEITVQTLDVYQSKTNDHMIMIELFYSLPYDQQNTETLKLEVRQ